MEATEITIETTIAYPGKRRTRNDEQVITFTIPSHANLAPFLKKPITSIQCYYRNLRFKYSTLSRGTSIKLTATVKYGQRGGVQLQVHELEVLGDPVKSLSKVTSQMMKKWTKQIEKQNTIPGIKPINQLHPTQNAVSRKIKAR